MQTREIPKGQWDTFLKDFSRVHLGQRIRLWVSRPDIGILKEATDLPLVGIAADRAGNGLERIGVIVGDSPSAHVTHEVCSPQAVRACAAREGGTDMSLQIDSEDGSSTYLRLNQPVGKATPAAFA